VIRVVKARIPGVTTLGHYTAMHRWHNAAPAAGPDTVWRKKSLEQWSSLPLPLGSCDGGVRFEYRLDYGLSTRMFSWFSSVAPDECWEPQHRPVPHPFRSFPVGNVVSIPNELFYLETVVKWTKKHKQTIIMKSGPTVFSGPRCILLSDLLNDSSTLKMEAICTSETSRVFLTIQRYHKEDCTLHSHPCENLSTKL
jgi:hypothetical protein